MPSIDVVIPTYRPEAPLLAASVSSALSHPKVDRVIVVDDGSAPPVQIDSFAPEVAADRITLLRQRNLGPGAARNRGLSACTADWTFFLDDDDEALPRGLDAMLELGERTDAVAVVAARIERNAAGAERPKPAPSEWAGRDLPHAGCVFRPTVLFNGSGILFRRADPRCAGLRFDPSLFVVEDRDFLRRVGERGPIVVCAEPAVRASRRADGSNLTGARHLLRRIRGHVRLVRAYDDSSSREHLRAQTTWLINFASKAGVPRAYWELLLRECRAHAWPVPMKSRVRRVISVSMAGVSGVSRAR